MFGRSEGKLTANVFTAFWYNSENCLLQTTNEQRTRKQCKFSPNGVIVIVQIYYFAARPLSKYSTFYALCHKHSPSAQFPNRRLDLSALVEWEDSGPEHSQSRSRCYSEGNEVDYHL